jgi:hypothetical protein
MLKAHVVKYNNAFPPKSHDLFLLLKKTNIILSEENLDFLGIIMNYQLEGRYPDYPVKTPKFENVIEYFKKQTNYCNG